MKRTVHRFQNFFAPESMFLEMILTGGWAQEDGNLSRGHCCWDSCLSRGSGLGLMGLNQSPWEQVFTEKVIQLGLYLHCWLLLQALPPHEAICLLGCSTRPSLQVATGAQTFKLLKS